MLQLAEHILARAPLGTGQRIEGYFHRGRHSFGLHTPRESRSLDKLIVMDGSAREKAFNDITCM